MVELENNSLVIHLFTLLGLSVDQGRMAYRALLTSLCDYSIDNRGDVGSWVREASMTALEKLTYLFCTYPGLIWSG